MSTKYPGGFITKSPVAPTSTAASGVWTLDQQQQYQKAGTWPAPPIFIEDLFSTYLYTGNGTSQSITNGIDLSGGGGLVWIKNRTNAASHVLWDTARGAGTTSSGTNTHALSSNLTNAEGSLGGTTEYLNSFSTSGFSVTGNIYPYNANGSGINFASWTFREQPKFFDIVTYTGNGSARTIAHNLGSTPGCIIIKCLSDTFDWIVWHRSFAANNQNAFLNTTDPAAGYSVTSSTAPTDTVFSLTTSPYTNQNGSTYVAYLFAHDAGGFPVSGGGSTNGISCGSFTTDGSGNATINLGYEPQWLLQKSSDASGNWFIADVMRGMTVSSTTPANLLRPNLSNAESTGSPISPTPTGFIVTNFVPSTTYIYIAIRRGPMKTPTTGTSVFSPVAYTGTGTATAVTTPGFPPDVLLQANRGGPDWPMSNRLAGVEQNLAPCYTSAENTPSPAYVDSYNMTGATIGAGGNAVNGSGLSYIQYYFRRAPGFFDEVCYTGTGTATAFTHNLGAVPQLMIFKCRSAGGQHWVVYQTNTISTGVVYLDSTSAASSNPYYPQYFNSTAPTSTQFTVNTGTDTNASGSTFIAYLFATVSGVSKVGTYTGTGALQTVDCGFTSGARFVLIKRTDSTGGWYTYDSARGLSSGNDPYLLMNSTSGEVNGTNYVDTDTTGFQVTAAAPAELNANGGTYIFLAIA